MRAKLGARGNGGASHYVTQERMSIICNYLKIDRLAVSVALAALFISLYLQTTPFFDTDHQYGSKVLAAGVAASEGRYRQARMLAVDALLMRSSRVNSSKKSNANDLSAFHEEMLEYELASVLISVGNCSDAKYVLDTLPQVGDTPWERRSHALFTYRHSLLGQALLGLREYHQAIEIASPVLLYKPRHPEAEFILAEAYLATNEPVKAAACLERMHSKGNEKLFKVYYQMTTLKLGDDKAAGRITQELLTFWREMERLQDPEGITNLELASDFMKQKGFVLESAELRSAAEQLKQQ